MTPKLYIKTNTVTVSKQLAVLSKNDCLTYTLIVSWFNECWTWWYICGSHVVCSASLINNHVAHWRRLYNTWIIECKMHSKYRRQQILHFHRLCHKTPTISHLMYIKPDSRLLDGGSTHDMLLYPFHIILWCSLTITLKPFNNCFETIQWPLWSCSVKRN